MIEIKQNVLYKKLYTPCRFLKPLIIFLVFYILMFIISIWIIKFEYIPAVISPLEKACQPEMIVNVNAAFEKILHEVYITGFMFISVFLGLILIIRNIKQFLNIFEASNN